MPHTPGPWKLGSQYAHRAFVHDGDGIIADCGVMSRAARANARLIAQAPAMLDLIARYVASLDRGNAKLSAYARAHVEAARKRNPQRFKLSDDASAILRAVEDDSADFVPRRWRR